MKWAENISACEIVFGNRTDRMTIKQNLMDIHEVFIIISILFLYRKKIKPKATEGQDLPEHLTVPVLIIS